MIAMKMTREELKAEWYKWWDENPNVIDIDAAIHSFASAHSTNRNEHYELVKRILDTFF
jgi:hypothetical protein